MFCSACGGALTADTGLCPSCGATIVGRVDARSLRPPRRSPRFLPVAAGALTVSALLMLGGSFLLWDPFGDDARGAVPHSATVTATEPQSSATSQQTHPPDSGSASAITPNSTRTATPVPSPTADCRVIQPGCAARVVNVAPDNLFLRPDPGLGSSPLERMAEGTVVCIEGTLRVLDNTVWWPINVRISNREFHGWAAEYDPAPPHWKYLEPTGAACQ